jgi:hypothetical protein
MKLQKSWKSTGINHTELRKASSTVSENEIYLDWTSKDTGIDAVRFRPSTDRGNTFVDKINLRNPTKT